MKVELKRISIADLVAGYKDNKEEGVVAYGGKLDVRPAYQREFVYDNEKRNAVIETIRKDFPLNILYWVDREDGTYEVLDGQQRIISICQFANKEFSIKPKDGERYGYINLTDDQKKQFEKYRLYVYFCTGTDSEKIDWFKIVNVAGVPLNNQEILNAVYHGPWLSNAKLRFSKRGCGAQDIGSKYVKGASIRQDFLKKAIEWINDGDIESYMSVNQKEPHATPLWDYFESIVNWVKNTFPKYNKKMLGVEWGELYKRYKDANLDPKDLQKRINKLMADDDVTNKSGIYPYVLDGDERHLNIRAFTDTQKITKFKQQGEKCASKKCLNVEKKLTIVDMEADHIKPWSEGGKTEPKNLQVLCRDCNRRKSSR